MTGLIGRLPSLQAALDNLAANHRVPGASLAIFDGDDTVQLATGVANLGTQVQVTTDTLFQIGSITKVYTTTLVMQLVDEGKLELDRPLSYYLPDLQLPAPASADLVTVAQLLNHTSGIVGDYFGDFGPGDDCVARYVEALAEQPAAHPPGAIFSYCNAAFSLAGHLIERITGKPFHEVFDERLRKPLGLRHTSVLAEEMLAYRYALGHTRTAPDAAMQPVKTVFLPRSTAPAGSRTSASAADVLRFARMHLNGGLAADGTRVLSERAVRLMQGRTATYPQEVGGGWGLGWMLGDWGGERVIGHPGGTFGQLAFLFVIPEMRFGVCLLTNSDSGGALWQELGRWIFRELACVEMPRVPQAAAPGHGIDLAAYTGVYERFANHYEVELDGDALKLTHISNEPGDDGTPQHHRLEPIDSERFVTVIDERPQLVAFLEFGADGRPGYIHTSSRSAARA